MMPPFIKKVELSDRDKKIMREHWERVLSPEPYFYSPESKGPVVTVKLDLTPEQRSYMNDVYKRAKEGFGL